MSTKNHTPVATGAEAAAATINSPLGQLDSSIGDLSQLSTTDKTSTVSAINELNTKKQSNFTSQSQNQVLASPTSTSGSPGFRALVNADLPNSGTAGTYTKCTFNSKGVLTNGANITVSDISDISSIPMDTLSLSDITTDNVSTTKHGLTPKLPNSDNMYLDGQGNWVKWASGIKYNGSGAYTPRKYIEFTGAGVSVQDDPSNEKVKVNISGIAGGTQSLSTLSDVSLTTPTANEVITYDSNSQTWQNKNISSFIPTGHVISANGIVFTNRPTQNFTGNAVTAVDNSTNNRTDIIINLPDYASGSMAGLVAFATGSMVVTNGLSGSVVISPSALAHSNYGKRGVQIALNGNVALTTNDKAYFRIPSTFDGWNLVGINASVTGSSTSGSPTFTVKSGSQTMLSTDLKINEGAYDSSVSGAGTINTSYDDVHTGNRIEITPTTSGCGVTYAIVDLQFQLP